MLNILLFCITQHGGVVRSEIDTPRVHGLPSLQTGVILVDVKHVLVYTVVLGFAYELIGPSDVDAEMNVDILLGHIVDCVLVCVCVHVRAYMCVHLCAHVLARLPSTIAYARR
jgi:uncharacterized membrane protein